jgi:hypothetical protein
VIGQSVCVNDQTMMPTKSRKKRWSELSSRQRYCIVLGGIAELIMTTIALRDLTRRSNAQVRGAKALWVLACFVQPIGPILYLLVGRQHER